MKKKMVYIVVAIVFAVTVFFVIRNMRNSKVNIADPTGFYDKLFQWVLSKEGGLQDKAIAGDVNVERSPCVITVGSRTYDKPFVNKGINYPTFKKYAPQFGYSIDCKTFGEMPYELWKQIYYSIAIKKGLLYTKNPILAAYVGGWYWGSGSISSTNQTKIKNILSMAIDEKTKLRKLVDLRKLFFNNLVAQKPSYQTALSGWLNRAESFWDNFNVYLA